MSSKEKTVSLSVSACLVSFSLHSLIHRGEWNTVLSFFIFLCGLIASQNSIPGDIIKLFLIALHTHTSYFRSYKMHLPFLHFNSSEIRVPFTNVWPFQATANSSVTTSPILPLVRLELFLFPTLPFPSQSSELLDCKRGSVMPNKHAAGPGRFLCTIAWL